jgi:hypothetical protein
LFDDTASIERQLGLIKAYDAAVQLLSAMGGFSMDKYEIL